MDLSFIIPCYKLATFLPHAIDSALAQTGGTFEVIVVDDGSPDATPEVAAAYGGRIHYVRKANAGLSAARNSGILLAKGRWLHFLDADDTVEPGLLARLLDEERAHPMVDAFVFGYRRIDEEGLTLEDVRAPIVEEDAFHQLLGKCFAPPVAFAFRKATFANAGLFDATLKASEDQEMWVRLAASGTRFGRIDAVLASYRQVGGSMSKNAENMWRGARRAVRQGRAFAQHRRCVLCRKQTVRAHLGITDAFVVPWVYGPPGNRVPGGWRRRLGRIAVLLVRNPSLVGPWFVSRRIRLWRKIVP